MTSDPGPTPESGRFTLVLAKEDFKFSVAHFTVFGEGDAELLHGHNYRVEVALGGRRLSAHGLLADVSVVKRLIRALCGELDSRTLIPTDCPLVEVATAEGEVEVRFDGRRYLLPEPEVRLLPLANTSIELLAVWFWERLAAELAGAEVDRLAVTVEETAGQRCIYERALPA